MNRRVFKSTLFVVAFAIILTFTLWNINGLLKILGGAVRIARPIIIGFILAFALNNPFSFFERNISKLFKKKKRKKLVRMISMIIVYALLTLIVFGVIAIIIPQLIESIRLLSGNIDIYIQNFKNTITESLERFDKIIPEDVNIASKLETLVDKIPKVAKTILFGAFGLSKNIVSVLTDIIIGVVISVYFLYGKNTLYTQFKKVTFAMLKTDNAAKVISFVEHTRATFSNFVTGQLIEALVLGVLCFVGMNVMNVFSFIRFEYIVLISTLICVTSLMPIVGAFLGAIPAVILHLMIEPIQAVWFVIFIIVLQQIEGNLIYPRVVGGRVGLPAMWVLIAIIVGGGLYGVIGMLFGVPTMSLIYDYTKLKIEERLRKKQISI